MSGKYFLLRIARKPPKYADSIAFEVHSLPHPTHHPTQLAAPPNPACSSRSHQPCSQCDLPRWRLTRCMLWQVEQRGMLLIVLGYMIVLPIVYTGVNLPESVHAHFPT